MIRPGESNLAHIFMNYEVLYGKLIEKHLGRKPKPEDGLADETVSLTERLLGFRLPESLRKYYLVTGNLPEINKYHNRLLNLIELRVDDNGFILFMEENQAVVYWGIKLDNITDSDPEVWQIINEEPFEAYSEELPFSGFIIKMMDWQFGELQELEYQ